MSNGLHQDPERLVRDAADNFKAVPGEEVWAGIAQAIRKKEKRRRFVWLFILPVILVPAILLMGKPFQTKEHNHAAASGQTNTGSENKTTAAPVHTASAPAAPQTITTNTTTNTATIIPPGEQVNNSDVQRATIQNIPPAPQNNQPRVTRVTPVNRPQQNIFIARTENGNTSKSITKRSYRKANKQNDISGQPEEQVPDVQEMVSDKSSNTTTTTTPVVEPAETIETKTNPAVTATVNENAGTEKTAVTELAVQSPVVNNTPEKITPVNPRHDAINQKPVFQVVTVEVPRRRFRYGLTLSAGGGYRLLQPYTAGNKAVLNATYSAPPPGSGRDHSTSKLNHRPALVASAGLLASLPVSVNWSIEAGVEYQLLGYNMPAYKTSPVQINYTNAGIVVSTVPADLNSRYVSDPFYATTPVTGKKVLKNQYHFVSVPVTAVYESNPFAKRSFYMKAGAALSYLAYKDAYIYSSESGRYFISPNPEIYRNLNIAALLEGGVQLRLKNEHSLRVGMNVGFNLLPTHNKEITLREYLYQSGIKLSYFLR